MNTLQGKNIQIFEITGKKLGDYNSIELTVHKSIPYLQTTANKVLLANQLPFSNYKVGDKIAVDTDRTGLRFPNVERGKIWKDSAIVAKVKKDENAIPTNHQKVYSSEEFGDG